MGDDLKPCPWCGRVPVRADISGGGPAYWVECYRCEATGPVDTSSSLDNAADAWNRRPAEDALQARAEAAEQRAEQRAEALAAELAQVRANALWLVAEGLEIVESLSAGYDVWAEQARAEIARLCAAGVDASAELPVCAIAEQRAEAAEREVERLRSAIAETLRLADIYAGVAAHNAEAEPETAGEAWRSPYMATMRELRRVLGTAP